MNLEIGTKRRGRYKARLDNKVIVVWDTEKVVVDLRNESKTITRAINKVSKQFDLGILVGKENRRMVARFDGQRVQIPADGILRVLYEVEGE